MELTFFLMYIAVTETNFANFANFSSAQLNLSQHPQSATQSTASQGETVHLRKMVNAKEQ
jgi:hypothetical protein